MIQAGPLSEHMGFHVIQDAKRAILAAQVAAPGESTPDDVATRVARSVAEAELADDRARWTDRFHDLIRNGFFLPSVPTLANAGFGGQLAACFALEASDTLDSIYATLHRAALIQQGSGGVGVEFSSLRPRGQPIERSGGRTPGPVAFSELFARSAQLMSLAGRRAGAHLAVLAADHPDIVEFVRAKREAPERFPQLGFAIAVSDGLLAAAAAGETWELRHASGVSGHIGASELLLEIAESILQTGDPTLLFVDRMEADNPTPSLGRLRMTNPCGEQPLLAEESCVLGSLHLPAFLRPDGSLDEGLLNESVRDAVRFLDDVHEVTCWPDEGMARAARRTRKLGLGVMGVADLFLLHDLPYDSAEASELLARIMGSVARAADASSLALAEERGVYPAHELGPRRRNATTRAVAPTGTLRLLAGCTGGIEPFLAPYLDVVTGDGTVAWTDRWLHVWCARRNIDPKPVFAALKAGRPHDEITSLGERERILLRRAWEISAPAQLAMQATAQRFVDGAVSKTIHLDPNALPTPIQLVDWLRHARNLGCKGVAFYGGASAGALSRIELSDACVGSCRP
jgi:ribonucleoside-diphosphate reductase alpha chain